VHPPPAGNNDFDVRERESVEIIVTQGQGTGHTSTSALDAALIDAGIGDLNLVPISAAIPAGATVTAAKYEAPRGQWGNRLYAVVATGVALAAQTEMWAGLGWIQANDGRGLLVRHTDPSRENVVNEIRASLHDMASIRKEKFGPVRYTLQHVKCVEEPVCCLVAAIFSNEGWKNGVADSSLSH
jgi:arginine decarboxylase